MKTNKFLQLILCLFFIIISCKKKDSTSYKILEKKQEYKTSNSGSKINNDSLKNKNIDISKFSKKEKTNIDNNIKVCVLPFDFTDYYNMCVVENDKGCETKYPSYIYPEDKNILESYGVKEQPSAFFILPRIHNLQPIILAFTDSDIEGYIFKVIDNKKVVSSLQIGKMDGEKIEDFIIKANYEIELYSRKDSAEKRVLKRIYRVQKGGLIK
ncbi:hypothetical protein D1632_12460 [Chryseobacterium nematophagum]|uniref:Uncharacterized protein n=1 Tax=Chryseobacterium nematophagum TaxID=2305228 RepID=A0A3M7L6S0_9FLAO|nr:hypothetical protein [Chryseobacterium nematophagum]RMZ58428.1 hypothetical protein D1632_12460 [Chryseobacterium nematophagum]